MIRQMYWKFPTEDSIMKLSQLLHEPYDPSMQDWEWQVADPKILTKYIFLYRSDILSDEDRFTLMEVMIQAIEEKLLTTGVLPKAWRNIEKLLIINSHIHTKTIIYWACSDQHTHHDFRFRVSKLIRKIQHKVGVNL